MTKDAARPNATAKRHDADKRTARENIYVNGSVLGFSKQEVDSKFEEIVEFAEIEEFLEMKYLCLSI